MNSDSILFIHLSMIDKDQLMNSDLDFDLQIYCYFNCIKYRLFVINAKFSTPYLLILNLQLTQTYLLSSLNIYLINIL